jgi:hypothetical protein
MQACRDIGDTYFTVPVYRHHFYRNPCQQHSLHITAFAGHYKSTSSENALNELEHFLTNNSIKQEVLAFNSKG